MTHETSFGSSPAEFADPAQGPVGGALHPLLLIVDPDRALEAARRMEANCRSGLRFFSDFRRVRPLDELDAAELEADTELIEDGYSAFDSRFDPHFSRRI
jgi:hypothetical protein